MVETLRCLEEGVLQHVADANIGSIMGIGAPMWTGGYLQFINTYGLEKFQARTDELADKYGEELRAPALLKEYIDAGKTFH
jgi:3-hydroxyacyl-CoA dehydrogenase/enoyl-CoA hydratase/3-hydroxybutyryl-CoA epimerase